METEMINKLLNQIEQSQYVSIMRHLSQHYKHLTLRGFQSKKKIAPIGYVANTAGSDKVFRNALLDSVSAIFLSGSSINLDKDIPEIKHEIPKDKWIGLAAFLLLKENEEYTTEANKIIDELSEIRKNEHNAPTVTTQNEQSQDQKEEKFRTKYLKAKTQIIELSAELERHKTQIQVLSAEINQLSDSQKALEQLCTMHVARIDALTKENIELCRKLEEKPQPDTIQNTPLQKIDVRVLAPNCKDILGKYDNFILLDYDGGSNISGADTFAQYDEIWVFPDVVPYSTYRTLLKLKQDANEKVFLFQTVIELLAHVEKTIQLSQTDRRRD